MRLEARRRKNMAKADFNIELEEGERQEEPYIKETVFHKPSIQLATKQKEPVFDYEKADRNEAEAKQGVRKAEAAALAAEALQQAEARAVMDDSVPFIDITAVEEAAAEVAELFAVAEEEMPEPLSTREVVYASKPPTL